MSGDQTPTPEKLDIAEVFAMDPLELTKPENDPKLIAMIAEFRSRRHTFNSPKPKATRKKAEPKEPVIDERVLAAGLKL